MDGVVRAVKWGVSIGFIGLVSGAVFAIDLISPDEFTDKFAAAMRASGPSKTIEIVAPLHIDVKGPSSEKSTMRLDNAYDVYKSDPESLDDIVQRFVASAVESAQRGDKIDKSRIVPMIKDRAWVADMTQSIGAGNFVFDVLNDDLIVAYAEDAPNSLSYFGPQALQAAGVERSGLRQLAAENLVRIIPNIERRGDDGVYQVSAGGDFEASLLAIGSVWRKGSFEVKGDFVFAVPARHMLYVTGSADAEGIEKVRALARKTYDRSTYKLSPKLFVLRDNRLQALPEVSD